MLQKIFTSLVITIAFYFTTSAQQASVDTNSETFFTASSVKQEEAPKPSLLITGSADVYFKYDLSKQAGNNRTSFTNAQNAFSLGMASVKFEYSTPKVSVVADLGARAGRPRRGFGGGA
jgi:hypothetical protein